MLKAPFPYFGGKSKIARRVWDCLGRVSCYIEPFFGSGAVLFARPDWTPGMKEIVNDADCLVANAWRAIKANPGDMLSSALWPVNHADLVARRRWIADNRDELAAKCMSDPEWYDAKAAGWWIYVMCLSIGGFTGMKNSIPAIDHAEGVLAWDDAERAMARLRERLESVKVICGDWTRVMGGAWRSNGGVWGLFLDPPYDDARRAKGVYAHDEAGVSAKVREWCLRNGGSPDARIVLCGYGDEHDGLLEHGWRVESWQANGCWPTRSSDDHETESMKNRKKERLWISPHCDDRQPTLF